MACRQASQPARIHSLLLADADPSERLLHLLKCLFIAVKHVGWLGLGSRTELAIMMSEATMTYLIFVVVHAYASVHGELASILCKLVHLVIQSFSITLTLLNQGLDISVCGSIK